MESFARRLSLPSPFSLLKLPTIWRQTPADLAAVSQTRYSFRMPYQGGKTRPNCRLSNCSLFQALRWWGRRERKRHAKSWRGGKKEGRESSTAPVLPSLLPFYFRVCAFSIQRTRLSRSLEQATRTPDKNARFFKHQVWCMKSSAKW